MDLGPVSVSVRLVMVCLLGAAICSVSGQDNCPCPQPPPLELTKPPENDKCNDRFRYTCKDGYVRKAGTSNLSKCDPKSRTWSKPNLDCIRDPRTPPLTSTTATINLHMTQSESTTASAATETNWVELNSTGQDNCPCPQPPPLELTKPPENDKCNDSFRYTCKDGYVRKAGTSSLSKCDPKSRTWSKPTLDCIRDPRTPPLTSTTATINLHMTQSESTTASAATETNWVELNSTGLKEKPQWSPEVTSLTTSTTSTANQAMSTSATPEPFSKKTDDPNGSRSNEDNCPCSDLPLLELSKPPENDECNDRFHYTCQDGYMRKVGTSNLSKCDPKSRTWSKPTLDCIRDPRTPPLTSTNLTSLTTSTVNQPKSTSATTMMTNDFNGSQYVKELERNKTTAVIISCISVVIIGAIIGIALYYKRRSRNNNLPTPEEMEVMNKRTNE